MGPLNQTANIATDTDTLTLTQFEQTKSENTLVDSGVRNESQQNGLSEPPERIGSPCGYFFRFITIEMVELVVSETDYCSQTSIPDRERLDLLGFVTQLSHCLIVAYKPVKSLVRKRGSHMSLSLSGETYVFKSRTAKVKKDSTGSPLVGIRLGGVAHLKLHVEKKGRYRHCKKSTIRNLCGKCGICLSLTSARNCIKIIIQRI
ncbi:hypothetical protein RF11_15038 [Thelohanellus kitauei]|uniref:PiggyBac transposable element-derived protein domain-containing protein n=1 Tax=Thelohanellus kitauei TaxID=669202 RepID=A0A0C2IES2_THEKT|nr:hypothetical protein RF11_15038 [Thelohanellus kitauei]